MSLLNLCSFLELCIVLTPFSAKLDNHINKLTAQSTNSIVFKLPKDWKIKSESCWYTTLTYMACPKHKHQHIYNASVMKPSLIFNNIHTNYAITTCHYIHVEYNYCIMRNVNVMCTERRMHAD